MNRVFKCVLLATIIFASGCSMPTRTAVTETGDLFNSQNVEKIHQGMSQAEALALVGVPPMSKMQVMDKETYSWGKSSMVSSGSGYRLFPVGYPVTETLVLSFKDGKVAEKIYNKHQMQSRTTRVQ
ncbi:hypothetical protein [Advenella mimigardefordensis]|uniref:hypothetical protein n=1 Tax=Advenella mimigardefordensis TaxID=302406 RepID=UPI0005AACD9D|nr:hypothetical protein [Advenella mimigardefordensis]